jgi:hypothetical protein
VQGFFLPMDALVILIFQYAHRDNLIFGHGTMNRRAYFQYGLHTVL